MLPENRFKPPGGAIWDKRCTDDEWLKEMISKAPIAWRNGICNKYSRIYEEKGRYEANKWLREGVNKYA